MYLLGLQFDDDSRSESRSSRFVVVLPARAAVDDAPPAPVVLAVSRRSDALAESPARIRSELVETAGVRSPPLVSIAAG